MFEPASPSQVYDLNDWLAITTLFGQFFLLAYTSERVVDSVYCIRVDSFFFSRVGVVGVLALYSRRHCYRVFFIVIVFFCPWFVLSCVPK